MSLSTHSFTNLRIGIVGGGAAGFFAAIAAAQAYPEARIQIFEAARSPLGKVRISGGGRCNVTHHCFDPALLVQNYPRGGKALRGAFTKFQPRDTVAWFAGRGVRLKVEADGRMFPETDDSGTIVDCLQHTAQELGVTVRTRTPIRQIQYVAPVNEAPYFELQTAAGGLSDRGMDRGGDRESRQERESQTVQTVQRQMIERVDRLLLATGSSRQGHAWAAHLGHRIVSPVPSLFTFKIPDRALHALAGVAVPSAIVRIPAAKLSQTGPLLITHWGLSGPAVLKTSAWGARWLFEQHYQTTIRVNWLPHETVDTLRSHLTRQRQENPRKQLAAFSPFPFSRRLWGYFLDRAALDPQSQWSQLPKTGLNQLLDLLQNCEFQVSGKGEFKDEFVTCGGVSLQDVDFKTMASRHCPGLFFAGEILDIDGVTGGFNFQNAWTTGWLAGQAIGSPIPEIHAKP